MNLEDKIKYIDIAPSLQQLIGDGSGIITETKVSQLITTSVSNATTSINNTVNTALTNSSDSTKDYIDEKDFLNLPPRLGFFGETKVALTSAFNMSYYNYRAFHIISDAEGREVAYFSATGNISNPAKLFKASRMDINSSFIFENEPVAPAYMGASDYPISVHGVGNSYIAYTALYNGSTVSHLVLTNGTSDASKWTIFKDITGILSGSNVMNVIYFDDYGTIATITNINDIITLKLYSYSTLALLKSVEVFNLQTIFNYGTYTGAIHFSNVGCAIYNKAAQQLVFQQSTYGVLTATNGVREGRYRLMGNIYSLPETFFQNGVGTLTPLIPNTEYYVSGGAGWTGSNGDGGTWASTYDEYEDVIRTTHHYQEQIYNGFFTSSVSDRPIACNYLISGYKSFQNYLSTPDACPWAKWQTAPIVMGEYVYLKCGSQKYGESKVCGIQYSKNTTQALDVVGGSWWISDSTTEPNLYNYDAKLIQCIRINSTTTKWLFVSQGSPILEVTFSDFTPTDGITRKGKRTFVATAYPTPPVLPGAYSYKQCWYNTHNNKFYYLVADTVSADPNTQGYCYILEYDVATTTYKEHRTVPAEWTAVFDNSKANLGSTPIMSVTSNAFIDTDGTMYISFWGRTIGGSAWFRNYRLSPQPDGSLTIIGLGLLNNSSAWTGYCIGYNTDFGYFHTYGYRSGSSYIACSKDYVNNGTAKTVDEFFVNGSNYTVSFGLSGSVGLVSNLQETPIFLGGYYSVIPAQEVNLLASSDNYIYLVRDRYDRSKVNVEVKSKIMGVEGENAFNRVLASKIVTDDKGPISQVYYDI